MGLTGPPEGSSDSLLPAFRICPYLLSSGRRHFALRVWMYGCLSGNLKVLSSGRVGLTHGVDHFPKSGAGVLFH